MTDRPAWLGVDVGTQSVRAIAVSDDGTILGTSSAALVSTRTPSTHEQDADTWWTATCAAIGRVTSALPMGYRVHGVAASATSGTVVVVDADLSPVSPGIMYDDPRGAVYLDEVVDQGNDLWHRLGHRPQATWALPKIVSVVRAGMVPPGGRILHQADLITARLAGRVLAADASHGLKSGADLDTLEWPASVFAALGIDDALPPLVGSGTRIGEVSAAAAAETGLPPGCVVIAGMTDGCAAQIAAGALENGSWNSVLGTTLVLKGSSRERLRDESGAIYAHRAPFDSGWFPGGASSSGAGALGRWLPGRDLVGLASGLGDRFVPAVAYPLATTGERFPFLASSATAIMPRFDDDAQTFAAIAGGVAAIERLSFATLAAAGYDVTGDIFITGGGSRNRWWNQLRADMLGRSLRVPRNGEGAIGMAVLAAAAHDNGSPHPLQSAARRMLGTTTVVEPRAERSDRLGSYFSEFVEMLQTQGWLSERAA